MKHLFVPYELALKLKEKGFDEYCLRTQWDFDITQSRVNIGLPLYQQVIDWFRESHGIMIACVEDTVPTDKGWRKGLYSYIEFMEGYTNKIKGSDRDSFSGDDYYHLLTKAIEEAIKLI